MKTPEKKTMSELEWLSTNSFSWLSFELHYVAPHRPRKYRLFGCGFCRALWRHFTDERCQTAVKLSERFADDEITLDELRLTWLAVASGNQTGVPRLVCRLATEVAESDGRPFSYDQITRVRNAGEELILATIQETEDEEREEGHSATIRADEIGAWLLRDIFGNPFRPVTISSAWRTSTVLGIAQAIYDERAFHNMPFLADALQDAGCDHAELLAHCRSEGPHVKGCFAVDLLLGKA